MITTSQVSQSVINNTKLCLSSLSQLRPVGSQFEDKEERKARLDGDSTAAVQQSHQSSPAQLMITLMAQLLTNYAETGRVSLSLSHIQTD